MCPNCTCSDCAEKLVPQHNARPYRCQSCDSITYAKFHPDLAEAITLKCPVCSVGTAEFCGLTAEDLWKIDIKSNWKKHRYKRLQEDHNWQEYGAYNPHAVPQRGTPAWTKYEAEGRIKTDPVTGMDSLYSKDYNEYKRAITDLGYQNAYGEGDINKSRQAGEQYKS